MGGAYRLTKLDEENSSKIGARGGDRGFDLEKVDFAKDWFQHAYLSAISSWLTGSILPFQQFDSAIW